MTVSRRAKTLLLVLWVLIAPVTMWLMYESTAPAMAAFKFDIISFIILSAFIAILPIVVNDTPILFSEGVTLAIFLFFGLFVEMIISQIAMIVLLAKLRVGWRDSWRIALNSLLFLAISLLGALVYYLLGGTHGAINMSTTGFLIPVLGYQLTRFLGNHIILKIIRHVIFKRKSTFFGKDFFWEGVTTLLHFPVGLVLFMLYVEMGSIAVFYVGIPLVSLSFILKLYYSSEKINVYLQKASEIGHQLAGRLKVDEVLDTFIEKICEMLPVNYAYILKVVDDKELHLIRQIDKDADKTEFIRPLQKNEGIGGRVWETRKAIIYNKKKEFQDVTKGYLPSTVESVLAVPVIRNNQVIYIIALGSNTKRAYEKYQLMIVDILASFFVVAIENARHYEETKKQSERCALTNLYNYRYFEKVLENEYKKVESVKVNYLSLILLDIDHFKTVNDTYGHQAGNDILQELATRLQNVIGDIGTVARYGGEEFVVLLPEIDKRECHEIAETIRLLIANRPFTLQDDLRNFGEKQHVRITASIGFATAPQDAEGSLDLLRHADRAMYTGAKQAGRNKVAEYVK